MQTISIETPTGKRIHECTDLPVFYKQDFRNPKTGEIDSIGYYGVEASKENIEFMRDGMNGIDNHLWKYGLVRHGHPAQCGYYPLSLLFATPEHRKEVAEARGDQPPKEGWITYKRNTVIEFYKLNEKPLLEKIFSNLPFAGVIRAISVTKRISV